MTCSARTTVAALQQKEQVQACKFSKSKKTKCTLTYILYVPEKLLIPDVSFQHKQDCFVQHTTVMAQIVEQ